MIYSAGEAAIILIGIALWLGFVTVLLKFGSSLNNRKNKRKDK